MRARSLVLALLASGGAMAAASCGSDKSESNVTLTGDALHDPNNCTPCHADKFTQWSGSMHAYAAEDPVFLAMNKRMLRETGGASATFCVSCHAPVALRLGLTKDGSNLADLPPYARGVTCFFCHTADSVGGTDNNPLHSADDGVLRGAITNPIAAMPHRGAYSKLHDREILDSVPLCGACHDVVGPHGAHIERTFDEWKNSLYAQPGSQQLACGKCHMDGSTGPAAAVPGAPPRDLHDHSFPAVDLALTPFFGSDVQKTRVQQFLDSSTLIVQLCVKQTPLGIVADVKLDNAFAGHKFPSGASQDRRVWVELEATKGSATVFATGQVEDKKPAAALVDPNLWLLRDKIFDENNVETHLFWQAARVESNQLPPAVTSNQLDPAFIHSVTKEYTLPSIPDRVTMKVRMRPLDFDLLGDLVTSGDLDPALLDKVPTYDIASGTKEWTFANGGFGCIN